MGGCRGGLMNWRAGQRAGAADNGALFATGGDFLPGREGTTNLPYNPLKRRRKNPSKSAKKSIVIQSVTQDCAARKRHGCHRDGG
jgi:hypothetical protein